MSWDKVCVDLSVKDGRRCGSGRVITYRDAITEAISTAFKQDKRVILFGEGVDDPAGVFGTTLGLQEKFGRERVFDTPICENTLTGVAIGAALGGLRPILVHMRTDFMIISMDQLINHAAKIKYMFGGNVSVPIVVRAIIGGGWGSAAQHSQPIQALFAHMPGLKVVMPSCAYDAKGLLLSSIASGGPVIFIEHRWLYDHKDRVPANAYMIPLGKAFVKRQGRDITIVADSFMVPLAMEVSDKLAQLGIRPEVIDIRTIKPLDSGTIVNSVKKTKRAVVLDFGYQFCGISSEISALITEECFGCMKGPVLRVALPDVPTPASPALEKIYYPHVDEIFNKIKAMFK